MAVNIGLVRISSWYLLRFDGVGLGETTTAFKVESSFEHHWCKLAHVNLHHVANSPVGDPATARSMPAETTAE